MSFRYSLCLLALQCVRTWTFDGLHGYVAINPEVKDLANIALDVQAMRNELERFQHNEEGIKRARKIYEFGGHSRSGCTLNLSEGLPFDMAAGSIVSGVGQGGKATTATLETGKKKGETQVKVLYTLDNPCFMGGLPEEIQQRDGCFEGSGKISIENPNEDETEVTSIDYTYDAEKGNTNERTIYSMSANAGRKFRLDGAANQEFFVSFQKYVDYYGEPNFGDRMINAAIQGSRYSFREGEFDFSNSSKQTRSKMMELFASYLNIGLFLISELENAAEKCADHCQYGDCHHAAIHGLDAAVAFYVGALQAQDESENGNLLYGLANEMCVRFKTCGPNGDQLQGTAKVNYDMFELFNEMRSNLENNQCVDARKNRDALEKLMFVPLVQGFRFATFRRLVGYSDEDLVDDAPPFSAAVLPILGHCKMAAAKNIQLDFAPGNRQAGEDLSSIDKTLHEHYECMGMCCSDVGGLWDPNTNDYHPETSICQDTWEHCLPEPDLVVENDPNRAWMLYVFLAGMGVAGYLYFKRWKEIKRRRRAAATGEYEDYDEDNSLSSEEDIQNVFA